MYFAGKFLAFLLIILFVIIITPDCDAWRRRRRRRRCTPRNCEVSYWSSWSACSTDQCGQQGFQRRSRTVESPRYCGGAQCPDLYETRLCYGSRPMNCDLSYWSEWSACTTVCGVSGKQTCSRHRIKTERCGGICTSTFYKTRSCPLTGCLNGGSLSGETCFCEKGFDGICCEKEGDSSSSTGGICAGILVPIALLVIVAGGYYLYRKDRRNRVHSAPFIIYTENKSSASCTIQNIRLTK